MQYRSLGRTGVQVSEQCLGCMNFGGATSEQESIEIIHRAFDAGVNFLDTANVYSRGRSEEVTGKAIQARGNRDRVVLATKVHGKMDDSDPNAWGNARRHIIAQCEASLRRLQTDYIDLYQIHRPSSSVPIDETLRALDDLIRAGKVRYIGSSTFGAWQVVESLWVAKELGLNRFICEQPPYHILDRRVERDLLPMARTYGIAVIPWSPLAGGFLTGKYKRGQDRPQGVRWAQSGNRHFEPACFDVVETLGKIAEAHGCTVAHVALAWCGSQPGVTSPIIGPKSMAQLEEALGAVDVKLTEDDLKQIDAVAEPGRALVPYYHADFGPHTVR